MLLYIYLHIDTFICSIKLIIIYRIFALSSIHRTIQSLTLRVNGNSPYVMLLFFMSQTMIIYILIIMYYCIIMWFNTQTD